MKKVIITSIALATSSIVYFSSCKTTKSASAVSEACKGVNLTYTVDIKPIIDANCASTCHSAKKKADGIDLSTYELVKEDAVKKHFLGSIKQESGFPPMPKKKAKLDDATIQKIECWIQNGMPQ